MAITIRLNKNRVWIIAPPRTEQLPAFIRMVLLAFLGFAIGFTIFFVARELLGRTIFPSTVTTELPKVASVNAKLYTKIRSTDEAKRTAPATTLLRDPFGTGEAFEVR